MSMKRLLLLFIVLLAAAFAPAARAEEVVTSTDQLSEATFGVLTGTTCGPDTEKNFPKYANKL